MTKVLRIKNIYNVFKWGHDIIFVGLRIILKNIMLHFIKIFYLFFFNIKVL